MTLRQPTCGKEAVSQPVRLGLRNERGRDSYPVMSRFRDDILSTSVHDGSLPRHRDSVGRGRIIAFEGIDGSGKSSVLQGVAARLRSAGVPVFLPRTGKEHDSRPTRMIRRLTRDARNFELSPRAELALYCAREAQVLAQLVVPAVERGETVLLDRSLLTAVVLGTWGRELPLADCEAMATAASAGLHPDITIVFDVDPRTSRIRKRLDRVRNHARIDGGRKGLAGSAFKERLRAGYRELASQRGFAVLHTERATPDELAERALAIMAGQPARNALEDRIPLWQGPPQWSLEAAVHEIPAWLAVYMTRGLQFGRAIRGALAVDEVSLAAWCMDAHDPLREQLAKDEPAYAVSGLSRVPIDGPDDLRVLLADTVPEAVARALKYVQGDAADRLRTRLLDSAPGAVVASLVAREDPWAWSIRQRWWNHASAVEKSDSVAHCGSEAAWDARTGLLEDDPLAGIASLRGVTDDRADRILSRHVELAPRSVLRALIGRGDTNAHRLRAALEPVGREVIDSVRGLDDETSWSLRERHAAQWPSTILDSLASLPRTPQWQRLRDRCTMAGCGDLHVLRRTMALQEEDLPSRAGMQLWLVSPAFDGDHEELDEVI